MEVVDGDRLVDLGGPRQRTLVAALAIGANRVVSADRLIDILWGERAPGRAAAGLQVLVSNLRKVLEPDRAARADAQVLVTRPPGYVLVVPEDDLDAARFEALLAVGQRHLSEGRPSAARRALDDALAMWRGPALAEFAAEDFARSEANRLEELHTAGLEDRLQADLALGRHAAAVADIEQLLGQHPLRERLWALLMIGYYRSGRQADALRAFQQARRHLGEELGIDPSPALQRLEADVLAQAESLDWRPPEETQEPGLAARIEPVNEDSGSKLVGRAPERRRLQAALDRARAGHGRLVLVAGEPGVGKTRLVEALSDDARHAGAAVCWGRCHPGESAPPFWPWTQVLRQVAAEAGAEAAPGAEAAALAQVVPELDGSQLASTGSQLPGDPAHARFRLCHDLAAYVLRASATRPLAIVLDDLHWADQPSLELLTALGAQLGGAPVLLVCTYRDVEVAGDDHPWAQTVATLVRQASVERLHLGGMSEDEAGTLIAEAVGAEPSAALVRAIHTRSDGNPFFMTELLRLLTADGPLPDDPEAALRSPVPMGVRDVISQRFGQLTPDAKALLTAGAVAGREFDQRLLDRTVDVDEDAALAAIELALARGILVEIPEVVGRYRFSHALIRETIYAGISGLRRARLHARVGEALEQLGGTDRDSVLQLAHHFWNAAPAGTADKAFHYALAAAAVATEQLAYEQAEDHLRRALDLVESLPPPERATAELQALARLGTHLAATLGQAAPEVQAAFARAAQLCRQLEGSRDAITALWGFFYSSYVRGELEAARAVAGEMVATADLSAIPEMAMAGQLATAISSFHHGDLEAARDHLVATIKLADELADPSLTTVFQVDPRVYARCFQALVLALQDEAGAAELAAADARRLAQELAHPFSVATAAVFSAWLGFLCANPDAAREHAALAAAEAESHGFPLLRGMAYAFDGWALARGGEVDAGAARVAAGLGPFGGEGRVRQPLLVALEAEVDHVAGRSAQALARLDEVLVAATPGDGNHYFHAALHRLRAEVLLALHPDRSDDAAESLRRSVEIASSQGARLLERRASAL
ncbi:MAG TPA: BTAD domain-containing putative transcriptional regulator, partial [Acidimicrobiales bacterium]